MRVKSTVRRAESGERNHSGSKPARRRSFRTPRSAFRASRAFTLVEVMIAIAIFSLVIGVIYSTWLLIMRASRVGQEVAAQTQRERIAIRTIEDGLTCIQSFQASMKYYAFVVDNNNPPLLSFTARVPANFPRNGEFGGFNVRRLTFSLQTEENGEKDLVLHQNPIYMEMSKHEETSPLILARNVKQFAVECWGTNTEDNAAEWVDEWDNTNAIPQLIRVILVLRGGPEGTFGGNAPARTFTRIIAVPSMTLPASAQGRGVPGRGPGVQLAPPTLNHRVPTAGPNPRPRPGPGPGPGPFNQRNFPQRP